MPARTNYSQVRQQEDDAQREDRLADQRHRQAVVRFVVVVVVIVVVDTRAMVTVIDDYWCPSVSFRTYLALLNDFQRRDQEDDGERLARLADQMTRQARVRALLFVFCTRMVSILILPRREITNLAHESWSEFLLFGMFESF